MMLKLFNATVFNEVMELDPGSGEFLIRDRAAEDERFAGIRGLFSRQDDEIVFLYYFDGRMFLRWGDEIWPTDAVRVSCDRENEHRRFVIKSGASVVTREYRASDDYGFELGWPSEEEDRDFFLFVANVLSSPDRLARLGRRWSGHG